jgi:hypothetical protein
MIQNYLIDNCALLFQCRSKSLNEIDVRIPSPNITSNPLKSISDPAFCDMDYNIIVETLTGNRLHFNEHKPDMAKSICDERNEECKRA